MDSEKEISIKVNIADRIYPLKVKMKEEEIVRRAAKSINSKVSKYRKSFDVRDKEDLLAMCALEAFTELERDALSDEWENEALSNKIREIKALIRSDQN